jgi:protein-disulfide isomerase
MTAQLSLAEKGLRERQPIVTVQLVEFGDYDCPHCRKAHPIVRQLKERFAEKIHFRFRNFPLSRIHPHAKHA